MAFSVFKHSYPDLNSAQHTSNSDSEHIASASFQTFRIPVASDHEDSIESSESDNQCSQDGGYGGFEYDKASETFNLQWSSIQEFSSWLENEQKSNCYELKLTYRKKGERFSYKHRYVCGRMKTGGAKAYAKQHPDWKRKIAEPKLIGCPCTLIVKTYPNTDIVLGYFLGTHSHPLGEENLKFVYISDSARDQMLSMIKQHVDIDYIVSTPSSSYTA